MIWVLISFLNFVCLCLVSLLSSCYMSEDFGLYDQEEYFLSGLHHPEDILTGLDLALCPTMPNSQRELSVSIHFLPALVKNRAPHSCFPPVRGCVCIWQAVEPDPMDPNLGNLNTPFRRGKKPLDSLFLECLFQTLGVNFILWRLYFFFHSPLGMLLIFEVLIGWIIIRILLIKARW